MLDLQYLLKDRPEAAVYPQLLSPRFPSGGKMLNGLVFTPTLSFEGEKSPCVILLHGFPGNEQFRDLAVALQRVGFVVVFFNFRGVWGSEGSYSFETLETDAANVLRYVKEHADELGVKTDSIYFVGHSMGGFTGVQLLASDEDFKGAVLLAPGDIEEIIARQGSEGPIFEEAAPLLHFEEGKSVETLEEECARHKADWPFAVKAESFDPKKPVLVCGGLKDEGCHPDFCIYPMVEVMKKRGCDVETKIYDTDHSFQNVRLRMFADVAGWLVRHEER